MPIDETETVDDFKSELSAWLKTWHNKPMPSIGHVSLLYHVMLNEDGIHLQVSRESSDAKERFVEERHV